LSELLATKPAEVRMYEKSFLKRSRDFGRLRHLETALNSTCMTEIPDKLQDVIIYMAVKLVEYGFKPKQNESGMDRLSLIQMVKILKSGGR